MKHCIPDCLGLHVWKEPSSRESCGFIPDVENGFFAEVDEIYHDTLVELSIFCAEGDSEPGRGRLDALTRITTLRDILKYLDSLPRCLFGVRTPQKVVQLI